MPSYDFKCERCGNVFELRQGMDDPNPPCPKVWPVGQQPFDVGIDHTPMVVNNLMDPDQDGGGYLCGGTTHKIFLSRKAPPVHFKGGGWFADGYSKK